MCIAERARSLVIWLELVVIGYQLVVALRGQVECAGDDAESGEDEDGPGGGDEVEARVEVPAGPEAGVVVEEVGLGVLAL